jgi:hypothetical protein
VRGEGWGGGGRCYGSGSVAEEGVRRGGTPPQGALLPPTHGAAPLSAPGKEEGERSGWMDGEMEEQREAGMDGWRDRWMEGWMDGWRQGGRDAGTEGSRRGADWLLDTPNSVILLLVLQRCDPRSNLNGRALNGSLTCPYHVIGLTG